MQPSQMLEMLDRYEHQLQRRGTRKVRMDPTHSFAQLSSDEMLEHAYYLIDGAKKFAADPEKWGKANRHFASIQMLLSFADWYTLEELMEHNR